MARTSGVSSRELFILGAVSNRPTYGHEIMQTIRVSEAHRWVELSGKHVYYVLRKLAREGWVVESEERVGNTPPRKVFAITDAGRGALREMLLSTSLAEAQVYCPFDTAIAMLAGSSVLTAEESVAVLRSRLAALKRRYEELYPSDDLEQVLHTFGGGAYALARKGRHVLAAEIEWLEETIRFTEEHGWEAMRVPAPVLAGEQPG